MTWGTALAQTCCFHGSLTDEMYSDLGKTFSNFRSDWISVDGFLAEDVRNLETSEHNVKQ